MQDNEKSANKIVVTVINQNGDEAGFRFNRNAKLKALMRGYCNLKSVDADTVAFLFGGCFLRTNHSPDELKMQDGDKIYAFHAESLSCTLGAKEGPRAHSPEKIECHKDFTFDEFEKRTNLTFKQAKSFLTGSFDKLNRLTKDARIYMEEVQKNNKSLNEEELNARVMIEKNLAEKNLTIEKMQNELQQANAAICNLSREQTLVAKEFANVKKELVKAKKERLNVVSDVRIMVDKKLAKKDLTIEKMQNELQKANAAISNLLRGQTLVSKELAKVKKEFVKPKKERLNVACGAKIMTEKKIAEKGNVVRDKVGNKRGVTMRRSQRELKRPRLHNQVSIKKSVPEEEKKPTDDTEIVIEFILDGESTMFSLRSSTMFEKLMKAYCDPESLVSYQISFIYDGRVIQKEQTPNELEMEDGEEIIVVLEAIPGELIIASQDPTPPDRNWLFRVLYELYYHCIQ